MDASSSESVAPDKRTVDVHFALGENDPIEDIVFRIDARKQVSRRPYQQVPNAAALELPQGVHLGDLLTPEFISRHSGFAAEDEMFEASGFVIQSAEDFAAIPDDEWDHFIRMNTSFDSWLEMLQAAQLEWSGKHLERLRSHG